VDTPDESEKPASYTGSDSNVELMVAIFDSGKVGEGIQPIATGTVTVSFTNGIGSGTADFSDPGPSPNGPNPGPNGPGRLTITRLADYNGKYVVAFRDEDSPFLFAAESATGVRNGTASLISNGSVTLNVWSVNQDEESWNNYSGNDSVELKIFIFNTAEVGEGQGIEPISRGTITVSFTNGVGSGAAVFPGRLTINGLSAYNGKYAVAFRNENSPFLIAAESATSVLIGTAGLVVNGSVTLNVWSVDTPDESEKPASYAGSNSNVELMVGIFDSAEIKGIEPIAYGTVTVSFTNGVGSGTAEIVLPGSR